MNLGTILRGLSLFAGVSDGAAQAVGRAASRREIGRGDVLVRSGDPSETIFVVVSGRFEVTVRDRGDRAEIGPGELIGEIGFFGRLARTATVAAIRDSVVLELDRAAFDRIAAAHPEILQAALQAVSRRLADTTRQIGPRPRDGAIRTVAVIPAGGSLLPPWLAGALAAAAGRGAILVDARRGAELAGGDPGRLNALEHDHDLVVYVADAADGPWATQALRQADEVILTATGAADTAPNAMEREAFGLFDPDRRRLLTLRERRASPVEGTGAWLRDRAVGLVHHAAEDAPDDLFSLFRILKGSAVGLVAGGGGGFGPAQIGIVRAFRERGLVFDVYGGTSFGSATATSLAFEASHEEVVEGIDDIFVKARAFSRRTIPRYSLVDHTVFDAALRARYGDLRMEDAYRPVFAVATDLSANRPAVIDRGPVWLAVRASAAIPAVLPPVVTGEGHLLVDGAVVDNVPVAPMKRLKRGPNLVIHFGLPEIRRYPVDYATIPGRWKLVAAYASPRARRQLPKLPSPISVIQHALTFKQPAATALGPQDLVVTPPVFPGSSFLDFSQHRAVTEAGYRWALDLVDRLEREEDPALAALKSAVAGR